MEHMVKRALIIVNPTTPGGGQDAIASTTREHLEAAGWQVEIQATQAAGDARQIAAANAAGVGKLVVLGGDGTLREAVAGLGDQARHVAVGLVPLGNANVVAREVGIPLEPQRAIALLTRGRPRLLDAGRVEDKIFLAMVGVGFDALATAIVGWCRQTRWGSGLYRGGGADLLYVLAAMPALAQLFPQRLSVSVDGSPLPDAYCSVQVCNTETYSTGWSMTPGALPDDGMLDHQAGKRAAAPLVLWVLLAAMLRRRVPPALARYGRGRSYLIRGSRPFRWQMDGDPMPPTQSLQIDVLPAAVRLIAPDLPDGDGTV